MLKQVKNINLTTTLQFCLRPAVQRANKNPL